MRKVGIQFREGKGMSFAIFASPPFGATGAPDIHWDAQCAVQSRYNSFHAFPHAMASYADDARILLSPEGHPQEGHLEASLLFSQVFHELLGIRLSQKATTNPANEVAFLGQDLNFKLNQAFPNLEKLEQFCDELKQLSDKEKITIRQLARTRGKFEHLSNFQGHFLTIRLNHLIRKFSLNTKIWLDKRALKKIWDNTVEVTSDLLEIWAEWLTFLHVQSLHISQKISGDDILIVSDAGPKDFAYFVVPHHEKPRRVNVSSTELKIVSHTKDLHKEWNILDKDPKSYLTEMDGLLFALREETKNWERKNFTRNIFLQTDNASVFWALAKQKATNPWQAKQIKEVFDIAMKKNLKILPRWRRRSEPLGKLADLGTRFQHIPLRESAKSKLMKKLKLRKWPPRILDHIDVLNLGQYGRGVSQSKLQILRQPNFISVPWSFPTRKIVNLCEVLDMYGFKGVIALPYIRNKGIKALRKRTKKQAILERSKKYFRTPIRSSVQTLFCHL